MRSHTGFHLTGQPAARRSSRSQRSDYFGNMWQVRDPTCDFFNMSSRLSCSISNPSSPGTRRSRTACSSQTVPTPRRRSPEWRSASSRSSSESTYLFSPIYRNNAPAPSFDLWRPLPLHFLQRASKARGVDAVTHTLAKYIVELSLGPTGDRDDSSCCQDLCRVAPCTL